MKNNRLFLVAALSMLSIWVGDPFPTPVPLTSLTFDVDGVSETFSQATTGTEPLIDPSFYSFDSSEYEYLTAASLTPGQACWVYASSATTLDVPGPEQSST